MADSNTGLPTANRQWSKDYVWRDGLLLASITPTTSGGTTTQHFHLDHLGTPRLVTGDNGVQLGIHAYYPFGAELNLGLNEQPTELMKFTGHERDVLAGDPHTLDDMHARYEMGTIGRFLSVDPGSVDPERPQSWNRYAYVDNSPISFSDATGRERGRYGPPPKLAPGAAREAVHKIDQFLTRVGQAGLDAVFVVGVIESVVETGDGELVQPAAEKLESDANVMVEEAETEGPVVFRGGSGIVARDSEIKVVNGEVQPSRGPSVNTDPARVEGHGEPHKIESLPQGLTLRQTGKDAGHYEIVPTAPVSKLIFQQLLDQIIRLPL
jgi:RHS repeat-associated protein